MNSTKPATTVLSEGIIVGLLLIIFTYVAKFMLQLTNYPKVQLPEICDTWNKHYTMETTLFLAGFLFHLGFEYSGINKWYAKNYPA